MKYYRNPTVIKQNDELAAKREEVAAMTRMAFCFLMIAAAILSNWIWVPHINH